MDIMKNINKRADGCWVWGGGVCGSGYGKFKEAGKWISAHRASYSTYCGPIPSGMFVLHKCDVKTCVNPDHLWTGTHADNMADMRAKGRQPRNGVRACRFSAVDATELALGISTISEIAARHNVSSKVIRRTLRGREWRHVGMAVAGDS